MKIREAKDLNNSIKKPNLLTVNCNNSSKDLEIKSKEDSNNSSNEKIKSNLFISNKANANTKRIEINLSDSNENSKEKESNLSTKEKDLKRPHTHRNNLKSNTTKDNFVDTVLIYNDNKQEKEKINMNEPIIEEASFTAEKSSNVSTNISISGSSSILNASSSYVISSSIRNSRNANNKEKISLINYITMNQDLKKTKRNLFTRNLFSNENQNNITNYCSNSTTSNILSANNTGFVNCTSNNILTNNYNNINNYNKSREYLNRSICFPSNKFTLGNGNSSSTVNINSNNTNKLGHNNNKKPNLPDDIFKYKIQSLLKKTQTTSSSYSSQYCNTSRANHQPTSSMFNTSSSFLQPSLQGVSKVTVNCSNVNSAFESINIIQGNVTQRGQLNNSISTKQLIDNTIRKFNNKK